MRLSRLVGLVGLCIFLAGSSSSSVSQVHVFKVTLSPEVAQKRLIKQVSPAYTAEMIRSQLQGVVKLKIRVTTNGNVRRAIFVSGNHRLVAAAIKAVKQWKYDPFVFNGDRVEFDSTVEVHFPPDADRFSTDSYNMK